MSPLFDTPLIDGLRYEESVISEAEERTLIAHLDALELAPFRFHGWTGNRRTQSFGWRYDLCDRARSEGPSRGCCRAVGGGGL